MRVKELIRRLQDYPEDAEVTTFQSQMGEKLLIFSATDNTTRKLVLHQPIIIHEEE